MADIRWEFVILALIAGTLLGGAVGMLLGGLRRKRLDKMQPVGLNVKSNPVFPAIGKEGAPDTNAALKYKDTTFLANRLFHVRLHLVNMGEKDFPNFTFHITLPTNHNAIAGIYEPPDRDHAVEVSPAFSPESWTKELGFTLRPFNRHDSYVLNVYIHVGGRAGGLEKLSPKTDAQIRFVDIPSITKKLEELSRLLASVSLD